MTAVLAQETPQRVSDPGHAELFATAIFDGTPIMGRHAFNGKYHQNQKVVKVETIQSHPSPNSSSSASASSGGPRVDWTTRPGCGGVSGATDSAAPSSQQEC